LEDELGLEALVILTGWQLLVAVWAGLLAVKGSCGLSVGGGEWKVE